MRIGINASFARKPYVGIGQVTVNFIKKLAEINNNLDFVLYLEEDFLENTKLPKNFKKRIFLPLWKRDDLIRKIWWEKCLLPKKIKQDSCDVFISLYQSATILKDIKHLVLVHDIIPELFPEYLDNLRKKIYWRLVKQAIKKADKILTVSRHTEKDLINILNIDPCLITANYIDTDAIYKLPVSQNKSLLVMKKYGLRSGYIYSGGGLEVRKNIEGVIRAYKLLLEKNKNLHYVSRFPDLIISGKLMPELAPLVVDAKKIIKKLNLERHVKFLDFVPQEDLPALYKNALFFIYPSFYEGFGLPLLEAMNIGTPAIASKKSSLPEVGSDAVLYCRPDDIDDIATVMKSVLVNKQLREKLSERGKQRAEYFSWEKFARKILNIIDEFKHE